ncbi:MAG TPA: glycosyltransferase family 39 protein [Gemmatimonadaceae bacterium]|nr:glycosyltransferase family 39 protein [Gemmatimonadaceae bacterium]
MSDDVGPHTPAGASRVERLVPVTVTVLVLLVAIMTISPWPVGVFEDDGIYTVLARSLATGEGYRLTNLPGSPNATHYPPGYPFVLSLLWRMSPAFPDNVVVFKFANAIFLALAALATWYFAHRRLGMSSIAAGVVAIVSTISIVVLLVTGLVLSEPLFLALLMPALLLAERTVDADDVRRAVLAGAALGALALVRTLGALAIPAAVVVLLWHRRLRAAIVLAGVAAAFLVPWQLWVGFHQQEVAPVLMGKYGAYGPWMSEGYATGGWPFARAVVLRNLQGLHGMLGYMLMPVRFELPRLLALVAITLLGIVGLLRLVRHAPVSVVFLLAYGAAVLVWPFDANRFLWAVWPGVVLAVWQGVTWIWHWRGTTGSARVLRIAALALSLAPAAGFLVYNARGYRGQWWASIQRDGGQHARPLVEWVAGNTEIGDVVATEADLIVHLYTGRRTTPVGTFLPVQRIRPLTAAEELDAMRNILLTYGPRFVIVSSSAGVASAEALAEATPPELKRLTKLSNALIYERVMP